MTMHGHTEMMQILIFKVLYSHWVSKVKPC